MILSIGMIVKNEAKNLRKCLEALAPLRKALDCELIITDTGSTDGTLEIAKEYADRVLHFDWCNDFAKARNTGLKQAKGQWVMFIDADEFFIKTDETVNFFRSGEYKKYQSAAFVIRNYSTFDGDFYTDVHVARLCKINKDTRFVNPIHESLFPLCEPIKYLNDTAEHYGYVSEGNSTAISEKYKRNADILLKELEQGSGRNLIYAQLCDAFIMADDKESAVRYCEMGLEKLSKSSLPYFALMVKEIRILDIMERYSDAVKLCERYFAERKTVTGLDLDVTFYMAKTLYKTADYEKSAEYYKSYAELYKKIQTAPDKYVSVTFEMMTADDFTFRTGMDSLSDCLIKIGNSAEAQKYLNLSPMKKWLKYTDYIKLRMEKEFRIMHELANYTKAVEFCGDNDSKNSGVLYVQIKKELLYQPDRDKADKLLSALINSGRSELPFIKLLKCCDDYYKGTLTANDVMQAAESITAWQDCYCDLIWFVIKFRLPLEILSKKIGAFDLRENYQLCAYSFKELDEQTFLYVSQAEKSDSFKKAVFMYMLCEAAFASGRLDIDKIRALLELMSDFAGAYLETAFNNSILDAENIFAFPDEIQAMFWCREAAFADKNSDETGYIRSLKEMLKAAPKCKKAVQILGSDFKRQTIDGKKQEKPAMSEFEMLALTVKNNIRTLISAMKYKEAENALLSYAQLNPADKEIAELRKMIKV